MTAAAVASAFLTPDVAEAHGCAPGYTTPPGMPSANVCIPILENKQQRAQDCLESLSQRYDLSQLNTQLVREMVFNCTNTSDK